MREGIHPDYKPAKVICACGNVIETHSTRGDFHVEICAQCHPFFTGKQKIMDTAGRIERFRTRYASPAAAAKAEPKKAEAKPAAPAKKAEPKENRAAKRAKTGKTKAKAPEAAPAAEPAAEAKPE